MSPRLSAFAVMPRYRRYAALRDTPFFSFAASMMRYGRLRCASMRGYYAAPECCRWRYSNTEKMRDELLLQV